MSQEILAAMAALTSNLTDLANDVKAGIKTQAEQKETLEKLQAQVQAVEAAKRRVNEGLPSDAPLDPQNADAATRKGGFRSLPLKKALEIPATHAMLQGSDADELKKLHDYHDACALKFHMFKTRSDHTQALRRLAQDVDFLTYKSLLVRNGFITEQKANEVMNPDGAAVGTGGTLDFTLLTATMIDKMRLDLVVADKFREITLTRSSQEFPTRTLDGFGVLGGSTTAAPPTTAMTTGVAPWPTNAHFSYPGFGANRQFNAKHLLVFLAWNDDMLEDSILPWLPMMREDLSYFAARTMDRAILDGDMTATHMDTDAHAVGAIDFRKAWYGLRKMSKNNWAGQGSTTIDDADLHALRKSLGIYGEKPQRLVYFMALKQYYDLIALGVISTNINTNAPASQLSQTGVLGSYWGIPIAISEFVRTDTDSNGVNASSGNTQSIVGCVNTAHFVRAIYGTVQVEETRLAPNLMTVLQSDVRVDFGAWDPTALTSGMWAASTADIPCNFLINCD